MDDREWMYKGWQSEQEYIELALKVNDFWKRHLIEDRVECRVHASSVKIGYINHNSLWVNILSQMSLWKTIPGGSAMVKPIVGEKR